MKPILFYLAFTLLLSNCNSLKSKDELENFMTGTFIRSSSHEFGSEYDTLVIAIQNETGGEYRITRRWRYERILDGQNIEPEYKRIVTTGIYDPEHKILRETESGTIYSFDPKQAILFNGPSKYLKQ